ncbi:MAG: hypothetical protein RL669_1880 [Pseudomonadota bacterium]|jgi:predicted dienelactone hydrolase
MTRLLAVLTIALSGALAFGIARGAAPTDTRAPYAVGLIDAVWTDNSRQRSLPLRLRLPEAPGRRPVVIFSHGLGGSVDGGRAWGEHWARQGFVVIHLQHPGSDQGTWHGAERPAESLRAAANPEQYIARVADVKFVLDELARRQSAGEPWAQALDLSRVGMSGHSFGALTTQALAGQRLEVPPAWHAKAASLAEPRLRAFMAFSPSARSPAAARQFLTIERPFFSITGSADGMVGPGLGVPPALRQVPFEGMPGPDQYLLVLDQADHMVFNGAPAGRGTRDAGRDGRHIELVAALSTAFWRAYLMDDAGARAWLERHAAAEVGAAGVFQRK